MNYIIFITLFTFLFHPKQNEEADSELDYNLNSPYQTIYTHLRYLQDDNYHPEIAAKCFNPDQFNTSEAEILAIQLKQVMDGKGYLVDLEEVPKTANYMDSVSNKHRYYFWEGNPDMYLEKVGSLWYYSKKTAILTAKMHKEVFPFGTFHNLGGKKYFGLYYWQYIGILILVIASFLIHKLFAFLLHRLLTGVLFRAGYKEIASRFIFPVARPISIFIVFFLLKIFLPMLQLPITASRFLVLGINAMLPFFATVVFYRTVDLVSLYFEKLASETKSTLDDQLVPLFRKVLKTFVVVIGGIFILQNLQIQILPLLAGLSIGGLAFALAAQDTVKNFFGSLMIFVDKPFQVGDWITSGDVDGTVEEVGARSTRIRTFGNSVIYVPNGNLANATIDNHGLRRFRRFYAQIAIMYSTPPDLIEVFVNGLKKLVENDPHTVKDRFEIHLNEMSDSSLNIMFYIFFDVPTWHEELECRHQVIINIIQLANELGVQFAFPTQTIHVENLPGEMSLSPTYITRVEAEKRMKEFLDKPDKDKS